MEITGISAAPFSGLDVLDVSTGVFETRYGGDELVRKLYESWPTRWRLSTFDADVDALLVEEVELACERIELATS